MLRKRIPNFIEHDQSGQILDKLTLNNFEMREEISARSMKFDSIFNKNLRNLFNKSFKHND